MINRINVDVFKETIENVKKNLSTSLKKLEIEGTWRLDEQTGPQFEAKLKTEKAGDILVQSDETIILGGGGTAPNPVQYFIYGLLSCYSATFVKWANLEGITLKSFKIRGTATMDISAALGISDNPRISGLQMDLFIESDTPMENLLEIIEIAKKRSPVYYFLTHGIFPKIDLKKNT